MLLRTLGNTDLQVSPLGLGMAALGRPGYINLGHTDDMQEGREPEAMEARAHALLDAAHRFGVRYFDAARSYGRGEAFLAHWLHDRHHDPKGVTVGSKWGYTYTADWRVDAEVHEVKDHSLPVLLGQWRESRSLLGNFLRLYQIHSATLESGVLEDRPVLEALAGLKEHGVRIGLTASGPRQAAVIARASRIRVGGERLFDTVQATWNLLEPSAGLALAEAHAAGMGVIIKEAVANGRLTARNLEPEFARTRAILVREARRLGTTVDALVIAAALAQPWVDVVLSGAASIPQLGSNLRAVDVLWDRQAAERTAPLTECPAAYWQKRSTLAWN